MEHMDKETFDFKFGQELVYTTPLSDGRLVELISGGSGVVVQYEDRMEFIRLVQKARLEESREQVLPHIIGRFCHEIAVMLGISRRMAR